MTFILDLRILKVEKLPIGKTRKVWARGRLPHENFSTLIYPGRKGDIMDTVNVISQIISNVGFPIAAYLLMWHTCNKTMAEVRDALNALTAEMQKGGNE